MDLLHRRSTWGRLAKPVTHSSPLRRRTGLARRIKRVDAAKLPATVKSNLADGHPPKAVKSGLAAVGGLIGLTAGSAAVSARRRRSDTSGDPQA